MKLISPNFSHVEFCV